MDRIVAIYTDLISGVISETEGYRGVCGRTSDVHQHFANDLIGIDADRVWAKGARLLPRSSWRSEGKR